MGVPCSIFEDFVNRISLFLVQYSKLHKSYIGVPCSIFKGLAKHISVLIVDRLNDRYEC
jgi:hypothetical protein